MIEVPVALLLFLPLLAFVAGVKFEERRDRYRRGNNDAMLRDLLPKYNEQKKRIVDYQDKIEFYRRQHDELRAQIPDPEDPPPIADPETQEIINGYGEVVKTIPVETEWKIGPRKVVSNPDQPARMAAEHFDRMYVLPKPQPVAREWRGLFVELWEAFKRMVETTGTWLFGPQFTGWILRKPVAEVTVDPVAELEALLAATNAEIAKIGPPDPSVFDGDNRAA